MTIAGKYISMSDADDSYEADVLIIGGGPAATWAACTAAEAGAAVLMVDKGYVGTSGATAPSSTGTWCVPPGDARRSAVERQVQNSLGLGDARWMYRTLETSYSSLLRLSELGYLFPRQDDGRLYMTHLRGPDYMQFMRRQVLKRRVVILDHHPALELLTTPDGAVAGAAGVARQKGRFWKVHAKATVLATGGCAFAERILGGTGMTGEGYLMAAEAGVTLSGMEFSGKYTLAAERTSLNKGVIYQYASFYNADGSPLQEPNDPTLKGDQRDSAVARALLNGPVLARLDLATPQQELWFRKSQPNCFLPFDRLGIDPFRQMFPVVMRYEGTVRGTGGINLVDDNCWTGVTGLFAAGDAASRENLSGGMSGGGAINASWAIASGNWAGQAAARAAAKLKLRTSARGAGQAGLRPSAEGSFDSRSAVTAIRAEMVPLDRSFFKTGAGLQASLDTLDSLWTDIAHRAGGVDSSTALKHRETAGMAAVARWTTSASLARLETRGLHRRLDAPEPKPDPQRILLHGVDSAALSQASFAERSAS